MLPNTGLPHRSGAILLSLISLAGWRRNVFLFLIGILTVGVFAPFSLWAILFFTIPLFYLCLDSATTQKRSAFDGFWFGYGFFMAGTYWIALSMTVDPERFAWMIPFSVLGLSAVLALSFMGMGYAFFRLKTTHLWVNLFLFSALWVSIELLRSLSDMGFAWNLIGYSLVSIPALLQGASIVGVYGLSLLAVWIGLVFVPFLHPRKKARDGIFSVFVLLSIICAYGYGIYYLQVEPNATEESANNDKPIRMRIVQANIPQTMKWNADAASEILHVHKSLSQIETDAPSPDVVIWSESAIPSLLTSASEWTAHIPELLPPHVKLIAGVVRGDPEGRYYNSLAVFDEDGSVLATYDKRHLVPFGEYMPLRSLLPLDALAASNQDFSRGIHSHPIKVKGTPSFAPIICYESIFPWLLREENVTESYARPSWLLLLTNDAWFGTSIGPYQHFSFAQMRAVEQGLPLVRVANTGISGLIDAHGKVVKRLGLNQRGVIDVSLPSAMPETLYQHLNEWIIVTLLLTIYLLVWRYSYTT